LAKKELEEKIPHGITFGTARPVSRSSRPSEIGGWRQSNELNNEQGSLDEFLLPQLRS
jgi:hypothetical protein